MSVVLIFVSGHKTFDDDADDADADDDDDDFGSQSHDSDFLDRRLG